MPLLEVVEQVGHGGRSRSAGWGREERARNLL